MTTTRRRLQRGLVLLALVALLAAACGDGTTTDGQNASAGSTTSTESTTPEEVAEEPRTTPDATEPPQTVPESTPIAPEDVEVTRDVRYGTSRGEDYRDPLMDVYAPPGEGPWPMVMMFHAGLGAFAGKETVETDARVAAAQGAVVFAPDLGGFSINIAWTQFPFLEDQGASCATSFVLENAGEFGGDPNEVTLAGVSGGALAAAQVAIADDPPGEAYCLVPPEPVEPRAVVMWEGDWVLGSWWDNALEANPSFYEDEWVLNRLDAELKPTWHVMAGSPERQGQYRYAIDDPFGSGDECGRPLNGEPGFEPVPPGTTCRWLELRDPTGDLRRDFDRLGFYDDGWLTITESSVLLADRLDAAGVDHTLTIIEGASHDDMTPEGQEAYIDFIVNG